MPDDLRGGVVAIGNFDGVHLGHQAVLARAVEIGASRRRPALALTFEPHPRAYFRPDAELFRLTPAPIKARLIEACGLAAVVEQDFDAAFAARSAAEFIHGTLVQDLGATDIVTGADFRFGRDRGGDVASLRDAGRKHGFIVSGVEALRDAGGAVISSSRIRTLLTEGKPEDAAALLGYRFTLGEIVRHGSRLGHKLGYPTANLRLDPGCGLAHGIYAARVRRAGGVLHDAVASFGRRPTIHADGEPLLEVHLFDFSGDLYGETLAVSLFAYLRPEEKFDGLEALKQQMHRDERAARAALADTRPLSPLDRIVAFEHR